MRIHITHIKATMSGYRPKELERTQDTPAAVIIPIQLNNNSLEDFSLLYIKRATDNGPHSGQIAFPGGTQEGSEQLMETAKREAWEEIGLNPEYYEVIGQLNDGITITGYFVRPYIAIVQADHPAWKLQEQEIADLFEVPWQAIIQMDRWQDYIWREGATTLKLPSFSWKGERIWGFTARLTLEFINLIMGKTHLDSFRKRYPFF